MTVKNGKCGKKSLRKEVISLKKPSALDKIIETVPKPKGAIPNFGLPRWKNMPLESKIPMIPGPVDGYNFTRRKLGEKLWVQTKNAEFNLSDPCNYEMQYAYDSLHDEHLTKYFSRKINIKRMVKRGFITKNLDAKCSLKDYNMYRQFLKKLHSDNINRELKRRSKLADEKRILEFADFAAQRNIERLKIAERKVLARDKTMEEIRRREEEKNQEKRQRTEELKKRKEIMELARKEAMQRRISKSMAQAEYARQKRAAAVESKKREIVKTIIALTRKESKLRKDRNERLSRELEEKRRIIEETWQRRKDHEIKNMATEQLALSWAEEQRRRFIENYEKKVEREQARIQRGLKKTRQVVRCNIIGGSLGRHRNPCCHKIERTEEHKRQRQ